MTAPTRSAAVTLGDLNEGTPDAPFVANAHYDEDAGGLVVTSDLAVHIPVVPPRCRKPRWTAFHTTATVVIHVDPDNHREVIRWEGMRKDPRDGYREQVQVFVADASQDLYFTRRNLAHPAEISDLLKADWDADEPTHAEWPEVWQNAPAGDRKIYVYFPSLLDNGTRSPMALGADEYWGSRSHAILVDDSDPYDWPRYHGSVDSRTTHLYYFNDTAVPTVMLREHLQRVAHGQRFIAGDLFEACYEPNFHYGYGHRPVGSVDLRPRPTQAHSEPRWDGQPISVADPHVIDYFARGEKIEVTPGEAVEFLANPGVEEVYAGLRERLLDERAHLQGLINDPEGEDRRDSYAVRIAYHNWEAECVVGLARMGRIAETMRKMESDFPDLPRQVTLADKGDDQG